MYCKHKTMQTAGNTGRKAWIILGLASMMAFPALGQTDTTISHARTLKNVQVSAASASSTDPLTTSNLGREQISDNKTDATLPYILELQPSIVAAGENGKMGNTTMRLRGIDATRINVNINGIPLNDAESQSVYWVNIPNLSGMAQNIQIQRGVTASTGGSASFGGALNLQTLQSSLSPYALADISLGSWNTRQYGITAGSGISKNGFSFDVAYNGLQSDGFVRNGFCDHQSLFMSGSHQGRNSLLKAIVILGTQHTGITWDGAGAEELDADPTYNGAGAYTDAFGNIRFYDNESDNYNQRHYQLYYTVAPSSTWTINAAANFTHGDGYYEQYKDNKSPSKYHLDGGSVAKSDMIVRKEMFNSSYTGMASAQYKKNAVTLSFGETFLYYNGDHFGNVIWAQDTQLYRDNHFSAEDQYEWYRNNGQKTDATTFVRMNYDFSRQLNMYADVQYRFVNYVMEGVDDDFTLLRFDEDYFFPNPKLGLNYWWENEKQSLHQRTYCVAGLSHREPTRADIKDMINPDNLADTITAERMLDIEAGYQLTGKRYALSANLYAMMYKDQLTASGRLSSGGYALMENVDRSYRLGIELEGGGSVASWLDLQGNLTLSRNKIIDYQYHYYDADYNPAVMSLGNTDLAFSPSVVGAAVATIKPECLQWNHMSGMETKNSGFSFQAIAKYVGEMYGNNTSRAENLQPDYFLLNFKVSYKMDEWCQLFGDHSFEVQFVVNNVLNQQYRLGAWTSDEFMADGSCQVYNGYYQQPGRNYALRVVIRF